MHVIIILTYPENRAVVLSISLIFKYRLHGLLHDVLESGKKERRFAALLK